MPQLKIFSFRGKVTAFSNRENYVNHASATENVNAGEQTNNTSSISVEVYANTFYSFTVRLDEDSRAALGQESASVALTSATRIATLDGKELSVKALRQQTGSFVGLEVCCKDLGVTLKPIAPVSLDKPVAPIGGYVCAVLAVGSGLWGLRAALQLLQGPVADSSAFAAIGCGIGFIILLIVSLSLFGTYRDEVKNWQEYDQA